MTLAYWREYRTYFHLGQDWEIKNQQLIELCVELKSGSISSGLFALPGKKALMAADSAIEIIVIDVTEHEVERPRKTETLRYSGKHKKHTLKSQIVVDLNTKLIVCIAYGKGKQHDFKIWKRSRTKGLSSIKYLGDKGYQGIHSMHVTSQTPIKKKPGQKLSKESSKINRELAKQRILIEHIHRYLKIFKV